MVLNPPRPFYVIPRRRLMTKVALVNLRIWLTRQWHGHHFKVHHIVTWRRLVALRAFGRAGRRMAERRHCPLRRRVTLGTGATEQSLMTVLRRVAARTIEHRLFSLPPQMA